MTILAILLCLPVALVNLIFVVEAVAGLPLPRSRASSVASSRIVVIVPAHDEQAVIEATLRELLVATQDNTEILVVADNCSDATAEKARSLGVSVTERSDALHRGKGFALDHARAQLRTDPPDCVVVIDADCTIDRESLELLAQECLRSGLPGQSIYLLRPDLTASPLVQISNFAFFLKNSIRQRGLQKLAGRVHLTGSGMAFPWAVFETANLASASIVEDLQLGLQLAELRNFPQLVSGATVWSASASDAETMVQRRRWEGGFLATAMHAAPAALLKALARLDLRGIIASLDLFVPPLAMLAIANGLTLITAFTLLFFFWGTIVIPFLVLIISFAAVVATVFIVWAKEGRKFVALKALLTAPAYIVKKLFLYGALVRDGAPMEWKRTERDGT